MGGSKKPGAAAATGKEKKKKQVREKKDDTLLSPVDKQFYELTIADLNNKLTRLRTHSGQSEHRIDELEGKLKQIQEDKADIITYLNRMLAEKVHLLEELEEKLTELNNVREEENRSAKKHAKELEAKSKAMEEQLVSEIKLLTGKLNSLEEFRIQRDEIIGKFEAQETMFKDQQKRHEEKLYEIEKANIIGKDMLKKEVEQRLQQLSNEFAESTDIRMAAHVQRLMRENIALNNEMDRLFVTHQRMQEEHLKYQAMNREFKDQLKMTDVENRRLVRTGCKQVLIIEALVEKVEEQLEEIKKLEQISTLYRKSNLQSADDGTELQSLDKRLKEAEDRVKNANNNRKNLRKVAIKSRRELDRILEELQMFKQTLNEIITLQHEQGADIRKYKENLLNKMLRHLTNLENIPITSSLETMLRINTIYSQGQMGFVPPLDAVDPNEGENKIDLTGQAFSGDDGSFNDDDQEADNSVAARADLDSDPIIDISTQSREESQDFDKSA